jgi:HD-like signal output (HDOD) protein
MEITPQKLLESDDRIASLPTVFHQILDAVQSPDSTFDDISRLIASDVSLAVQLLKLVNSSFYGFTEKIDSISHALNIIGTEQLSCLVMASAVVDRFDGIPEEFVTMESFWHHSVACGLAARSIAKHKRFSNPENLYVAGMLHDIGSLVIYKQIPEKALEALTRCNQWGIPLAQAEKEVFGFDHTLIGKLLIEQWKLPESWAEIAQFHHNPRHSTEYAEETAIVHLADHIAHNSRLGSAGHSGTKSLDESVWETLNIDPSIKGPVFREMLQLFNDTVEMFIK